MKESFVLCAKLAILALALRMRSLPREVEEYPEAGIHWLSSHPCYCVLGRKVRE